MTDEQTSATNRVVDSHIHFWDTDRLDYPWLRAHPDLQRPFLPTDLDAGDVFVEALLFVQANPVWEQVDDETGWVIGLASGDPRISAIVAGAELNRGPAAVAGHLNRLRLTSGVVGVRQLIEPETTGFALAPDFVDAVRLAGEQSLVVDLCIRWQQLAEVTRLVEQCPEVSFVLDHLGKPDIAGGERASWATDLARLARLDNVSCKLSGLMELADERTNDPATIGDYLRTGVDLFGPARCMFGSDWPNASLHISYQGWVAVVLAAVADLRPDEQDQIMRGTARSVYHRAWVLEPTPPVPGPLTGGSRLNGALHQS